MSLKDKVINSCKEKNLRHPEFVLSHSASTKCNMTCFKTNEIQLGHRIFKFYIHKGSSRRQKIKLGNIFFVTNRFKIFSIAKYKLNKNEF